MPILLPKLSAEASALGAVIAGGVGVGIFSDYSEAKRLVPAEKAEQPDPANVQRYETLFPLFEQSYNVLVPLFEQLADLAD